MEHLPKTLPCSGLVFCLSNGQIFLFSPILTCKLHFVKEYNTALDWEGELS